MSEEMYEYLNELVDEYLDLALIEVKSIHRS